jgi:hypothetical protein
MVSKQDVSLDFFPAEWAQMDDNVLQGLGRDLRKALFLRLDRGPRGAWRDLRNRLAKINEADSVG